MLMAAGQEIRASQARRLRESARLRTPARMPPGREAGKLQVSGSKPAAADCLLMRRLVVIFLIGSR